MVGRQGGLALDGVHCLLHCLFKRCYIGTHPGCWLSPSVQNGPRHIDITPCCSFSHVDVIDLVAAPLANPSKDLRCFLMALRTDERRHRAISGCHPTQFPLNAPSYLRMLGPRYLYLHFIMNQKSSCFEDARPLGGWSFHAPSSRFCSIHILK